MPIRRAAATPTQEKPSSAAAEKEPEETQEESPSADEEQAASSAATNESPATEGEGEDGAAAGEEEPTENGEKAEEADDGYKYKKAKAKKVKRTIPAWASVTTKKKIPVTNFAGTQNKVDNILIEAITVCTPATIALGFPTSPVMKYIVKKYPGMELDKKKFLIKKAMKKHLEKGTIKQNSAQKQESLGDALPLIITRLCEPKEASYNLIKKYLEQHFPSFKIDTRPEVLKTALVKAVERGQLEQITGKGASGTFQLKRSGNKVMLKGGHLEDAITAAITAMNEPKTCSTTTLRKYLLDANKDIKEYQLVANLRRTLTKCKVLGWMEQITGHGFTGTYRLSFPFYPSPTLLYPEKFNKPLQDSAPKRRRTAKSEDEDESEEEEEDEDDSEDEAPPRRRCVCVYEQTGSKRPSSPEESAVSEQPAAKETPKGGSRRSKPEELSSEEPAVAKETTRGKRSKQEEASPAEPAACKRRRPVSLKFSIKGVKMYDEDETTLLMAHALRRVSLSTARPADAQFAFVSHNPGSADAQLYCHVFKARHARAAQFLNLLLCRCFQLCYVEKHPEEAQEHSSGPVPRRSPSLLNHGFPLSVSALKCKAEFDSLAELIDHYTEEQDELPCVLSCARVNHCYEWEESAIRPQAEKPHKGMNKARIKNMGSEAVKVVVRCRPLNDREKALGSKMALSMDLQRCQCFIEKPSAADEPPKQFTFDGTYFIDQTTEQMYNEIAYPLVEGVTEGYNGTVFAYGQTGSGKSFTMQGVSEPSAQRGVIPRAFEHIFESIQCAENTKFLVRASYLEIYNEEIRDLLGNDTKQRLELKEHPERGVYVRDLSMHTVHSVGECERIVDRGWRNRAVGYTLMNKDSSRSHSIFTVHLEICSTDTAGGDHLRAGKLNLVDLAGSERQSKTGATGERLREATKINLSLSALGNVISALVDGRSKYIPYRDSKLTRLLQDSLGGNTRTLMIACLSPADNNYEESLSTLRYANRAKSIQNRPRINEDPKDALLREYQEEIRKLQALISGQMATADLSCEDVPVVPSRPESSSDAEREKIKAEYEERFAKLQAEYDAEQQSKAKLQEDIAVLRSSYESKLSNLEKVHASRWRSDTKHVNEDSTAHNTSGKERKLTPIGFIGFHSRESGPETCPGKVRGLCLTHQRQRTRLKSVKYLCLPTSRLQQLEQQVVGGEQARNKELQQRHRQRKSLADQRKIQLISALSEDSEESENVLFNVYNSIQEEVHAKGRMLAKVQEKLKAAQLEIRDLQSEFEVERNDYLATIRRLEKDDQLLHSLLERMVLLVRRDCNYSNLDRLKKEAVWDEDSATWRLPDVLVQKTTLPSAVSPKLVAHRCLAADTGEQLKVEEDRYKEMLDRSDSANIASSYFKSKRASQLLAGESAKGHAVHSPTASHLTVTGSNINPPAGLDPVLPRPFRLESLDVPMPNSKVKRKKIKSHLQSEGN
ncbi:unnamed protein product [Lampetra planeri]